MRIVKVGVLAPTNKGIPLGVQGENLATDVEFDTRPWFREYPSGTVSAVAKRYGDHAPYPLTLDVADGTAVWQVSDTDTAKAGEGAVELTMTSAGTRVRSLTFKTLVTASLTDAPVDDDAWYGWLDKAVVKVDETVQSAQRKMAEVDEEWTGLKADVTSKVDECGKAAAQAAEDAHHAKVDAQATAKALESAEGSVAKAEAAANRAVDAALAADDSAVEASRSAQSAGESAEAAAGSATNAATSASEAATSASSAADAASAASGSASAAEQSATDASNAKAEAQTAKAEAEAAKGEAATSASNAADSATAAAKSASDAAASVEAINVIAPKSVDIAPTMVGGDSLAIGRGAKATDNGNYSVVIGSDAHSHSIGNVVIGPGASDTIDSKGQNVILGDHATASGTVGSIVLGSYSKVDKDYEMSIGNVSVTREITHVSEPTATTSASTKKYTDDNDTKTLTEAKKYTDENTSNALVGNVSGNLLHVEDAWPSPVRELVVYGKSVQDGTPTPDAPVPIVSVGKLSVTSTGKNMIPVTATEAKTVYGVTFTPLGDGTIRVSGTASANATFNVMGKWKYKSGINLPKGAMVGGLVSNCRILVYGYDNLGRYENVLTNSIVNNNYKDVFAYLEVGEGKAVDGIVKPIVYYGDKSDFVPYNPASSTTPNLLVSEDGTAYELRRLPDGTCDEIVVSDGRARINCVLRKEVISDVNYIGNTGTFQYVQVGVATGKPIDGDTHFMCNRFIAGGRYAGGVYVEGGVNAMFFFCFPLGTFQDSSEAESWFAANSTTVVYKDANGIKTINLGKLDIPALPETISNVWTEAELTTNMTMTYKRDINIAFGSLVQAVVAAAAGE